MNKLRVVLGYLLRKSDPYYEYGLERERVKPQVVRIKPWGDIGFRKFKEEPRSLDKFRKEHTTTYADHEFNTIKIYSYDGHSAINKTLRGDELGANDLVFGDIEDHISNLDSSMKKSPTKSPVVVWRGLSVFTKNDNFHPLEEKLIELDAVYEDKYAHKKVDPQEALKLKGFTFTDPSFVSTSLNRTTALKFTKNWDKPWSTPVICEIKVPAGTQAIYAPGAHKLEGKGIKDIDPIAGEVELLLDRGLRFRVTNVALGGVDSGRTGLIVHLDIVESR